MSFSSWEALAPIVQGISLDSGHAQVPIKKGADAAIPAPACQEAGPAGGRERHLSPITRRRSDMSRGGLVGPMAGRRGVCSVSPQAEPSPQCAPRGVKPEEDD